MAFIGSISLGGAILGAGAIGAVGAVGSSIIGSNAAKDAANIQAQAGNNALAFQNTVFNQNQQNYQNARDTNAGIYDSTKDSWAPYTSVGNAATYSLGSLYGLNGNGNSTPDYSQFYNSPDYGFAQSQGELGLTRQENATGMNLSGGALKDFDTFNQGLASQQFGNYFNRLLSLSQMGQSATSAAASYGSNYMNTNANLATGNANSNNASANSIGNTIQGIGQSQASGVVGSANALSGGIAGVSNNASSAVNNSLLYNAINRSGYAPSSGSSPLSLGNAGGTGGGLGGLY